MSYLNRIKASEEVKVQDVVTAMMADHGFMSNLPALIDAAKAAITFGHTSGNQSLVKFNTLCLHFFNSLKKKDQQEALQCADALVKAGHGKAFGLN